MHSQVKIGTEFFRKVKLDYADWRWALVREFLQNCFDAPGCKNVQVTVSPSGCGTMLTVANDGKPMDQDTLVNKLLTLGGSGKNFEGENTGGFGVAKSLLYYTHTSYTIRTGTLTVQGSGAQYSISESPESYPGTVSSVNLEGDEQASLINQVKRFAAYAQWKGTLTLNGEVLVTDLHKGARRKDLGWGVVYTNQSFTNLCIVRLNGQPMFTRYTKYKGTVLIELTGKAKDVLTSNRDGLVGKYASELGEFLTSVAIDKRSALREQRAEYKRYQGEKLKNEAKQPKSAEEGLAAVVDPQELAALVTKMDQWAGVAPQGEPAAQVKPGGGIQLTVVSREDEPDATVSVGPQFILKNTTGKKAPVKYVPGDRFAPQARSLVRTWTALLLKLHQLANRSGEFSVGFVFDDESEAESEKTKAYGQVYYVNPVKDGKPRFASPWLDRHALISLAAHEFVHGAYGLGEHDEDYAGKLTDVMALCQRHAFDLSELCWDGTDPRLATTEQEREEQYLCAVFMLEQQEQEIAALKARLATLQNNS